MSKPYIAAIVAIFLLSACKKDDNKSHNAEKVLSAETLMRQENTDVVENASVSHYTDKRMEIPRSNKSAKEQIINHLGYTTSYNSTLRIPNWVAYELTPYEARAHGKRSGEFQKDPLAVGTSASPSDYSRSGYGRGHMAPAGDMKWSSKAMHETFYLSNICPQDNSLNAGLWNDLEMGLRQMSRQGKTLYIVCGPLMSDNPRRIGRNKVAVPSSFFKVVLRREGNGYEAIGYIFPNTRSSGSVNDYACTVDEVEAKSGMDFFPLLPDDVENSIEATRRVSQWQWETYGSKDSFQQRSSRKKSRAETRK